MTFSPSSLSFASFLIDQLVMAELLTKGVLGSSCFYINKLFLLPKGVKVLSIVHLFDNFKYWNVSTIFGS